VKWFKQYRAWYLDSVDLGGSLRWWAEASTLVSSWQKDVSGPLQPFPTGPIPPDTVDGLTPNVRCRSTAGITSTAALTVPLART
jgi:hypothetical protein